MAFTFAHPAAVIPLNKNKKCFHFTALVLGSMAPDFEYFCYGKPIQIAGHTFAGLITVDLPLVLLVWFLYERFVREAVLKYMPRPFWDGAQAYRTSPQWIRHGKEAWTFTYSAILGMLTHLAWDACTHQTGWFVQKFEFLQQRISLLAWQVPVYKMLQHGSTLIGFICIACFFLCKMQAADTLTAEAIPESDKHKYWGSTVGLSLVFAVFFRWLIFDGSLGGWVIGILDSVLLALLFVSIADCLIGKKSDSAMGQKEHLHSD